MDTERNAAAKVQYHIRYTRSNMCPFEVWCLHLNIFLNTTWHHICDGMSALIFAYPLRLHFCLVGVHISDQVHKELRMFVPPPVSIHCDDVRRHVEESAKIPCQFGCAPV